MQASSCVVDVGQRSSTPGRGRRARCRPPSGSGGRSRSRGRARCATAPSGACTSRRAVTSATTSKYIHHSADGQRDAEDGGGDHAGGEIDLRRDAEGDDRLAEGDDDDEVVALGEVGGRRAVHPAMPKTAGSPKSRTSARTQSASCQPAVDEGAAEDEPDADRACSTARPTTERRSSWSSGWRAGTGRSGRTARRRRRPRSRGRGRRRPRGTQSATTSRPPSPRTSRAGRRPPPGRSRSSATRSRPTPTTARASTSMPRPMPAQVGSCCHQRRALGEPEDEDEVEEQLEGEDDLAFPQLGVHPPRQVRAVHPAQGHVVLLAEIADRLCHLTPPAPRTSRSRTPSAAPGTSSRRSAG